MQVGKLVSCKLVSGEEIIGELTAISVDHIVVKKARVITFQAAQNNRAVPALMVWMLASPDGEIMIRLSAISGIVNGEIHSEFQRFYLQSTTGLDLVTSPPPSASNEGVILR